ncbi:hypothetical protein [Altererythrobacter sp. Root672]|uniref:hypothetical protein n=1 Tax=Altererythrobacter sp. Root672 TaxID=1736584 RepID=UPI0006F2A0A0|nr:hypothetical protein [Altererythrobacter sp. Root672]KRA84089.1 hypothetical protein ASD76_08840 [Altererythrobacter sp. Root672]
MSGDTEAQQRLLWLLDAPLFVDEALVARLFDAVVRPDYEVQSRQVGHASEDTRRRLFGAELTGGYDLGLSFLTGKLKLEAKGTAEHENAHKVTDSSSLTEVPVDTAGRRLEEIALTYLNNHPERIVFVNTDGTARDFTGRTLAIADLEKAAVAPPRMLAFVNVAAGTPIIPMACELEKGGTRLLFERYINELWKDDAQKPTYPTDRAELEARRAYWAALAERFSSRTAMELIEAAGTDGRLGWIDFRMPIGSQGDAMHLHAVLGGRYYTGDFAYNLVRRGNHHGIRLVGTMKAGMDLNILAVFDR